MLGIPGIYQKRRTTPQRDQPARLLRVTHPFHPLTGRTFEWVSDRVRARGEWRVQFRDDRDHLHSMPASWTDLVEPDPVVQLADGRAYLRVEDLLRLVDLLARTGE